MEQTQRDKEVSEFLASIIQKMPYYLDNKIMDSFDVVFSYKGKTYQLALIEDGKVRGRDFGYLDTVAAKN